MGEPRGTKWLEEVKADAERLTLRRIRLEAEENELPVPPRAAGGDKVLPKAVRKSKPVETPETDETPTKSLSQMNKTELLEAASEAGVKPNKNATNKEIRDAIKSV